MKKLQIFSTLFLFAFGSAIAQNKQASTALQKNDQQFFIENKGQWNTEILYMTSFGGLNAFITKKGIVYDFYELKEVKDAKKMVSVSNSNEPEPLEMEKYGHMIRINLLGCNEKAATVGKEKSKTYYNYLVANDTAHSRGYVGLYKEVALTKVYDHIDMSYYFEGNSLRYDYILKPGANASQIKMQLEGSEHSYINSDGEWIFETRFGEVKNTKLLSYQIIDGEKKVIPSKFKKDEKGNVVFELGAYDDTKELVIDPLVYSTLIGTTTYDYGTAIAIDDSNNVIITGYSNIFNWLPQLWYPTTPGAYYYGVPNGAKNTAIISKFNPDLSTLLYSSFFFVYDTVGISNARVRPVDISLGLDHSINIVGTANSPSTIRTFYAAFNSDCSSILHAILVGGIAVGIPPYFSSSTSDINKNCIVAGGGSFYTMPPPGPPPISDTLFTDYVLGGRKAIILKKDSNDIEIFDHKFGSEAFCSAIVVDSTGNIFATGTFSMNHPNYPFPAFYDSTFNGGSTDVFIAKFNPSGVLLYLSYLGGAGADSSTSLKLDKQGNIYILGYTNSVNFPTTAGCLQDTLSGVNDIFISKFDPSGLNLLYSTYFGGPGFDYPFEMQVDSSGRMYFAGETSSGAYPTTAGCFNGSNNGLYDIFVSELNEVGDSLLYSTYMGSPAMDRTGGLAVDNVGDVYVTGTTFGYNTFPTTPGSYHPSSYGDYDIFVSKLKLTPCPVVMATASSNTPLCVGGMLNLTSNMTGGILPYMYQWYGPNGFTSAMQNVSINNITIADSGIYAVNITDANGCNSSATILATVGQVPTVVANNDTTLCEGQTLDLTVTPTAGATYNWTGPNGFTSPLQNPSIANVTMAANGDYTVDVVDSNGCSKRDTTNVKILVCTGIAESMQDNTILIFPNPNNGTFTLQTSKLGNYELLDVAGRIINTYEVKSSPYIITEKLASGMYFIREKDGGGTRNHRVAQKIMIE